MHSVEHGQGVGPEASVGINHVWQAGRETGIQGLQLVEQPIYRPTRGRVLVRVCSAGIDEADLLLLSGKDPRRPPKPWLPGQEIAGLVAAVPHGSRYAVGQPVAAVVGQGGLATHVMVEERNCVALPPQMPWALAVALVGSYARATLALTELIQVHARTKVLVHSGASGLGIAGIHVAKALGASVAATTSSEAACDFVLRNGVDHPINERTQDWVEAVRGISDGQGAAVVVDTVGGDTTKRSLRCIRPGGDLLILGFSGQVVPSIGAALLVSSGARVQAMLDLSTQDPTRMARVWDRVLRWHHSGLISPVVYAEHGLRDLPQALAVMGQSRVFGKHVVVVG